MIDSKLGLDLANEIKTALQRKSYELSVRNYPGKVVSNNDPDKLGRCQIRVYGVYGDLIPDSDLPWAIPDFNFIGSNLGSFVVPTPGTLVNVYFESNDLFLPRYSTKLIDKPALQSMVSGYDEDYPDSMVFFETDNGDYFKINRRSLDMTFRHASGLIITIDKDGNTNIDNTTTTGGLLIKIAGDVDIDCQSDAHVRASGKLTLEAGTGDLVLKALGAANWIPNALPVCAYSGISHGGPATGILNLKGA
jgi:hypothetical protein